MDSKEPTKAQEVRERVAARLDADIILHNGSIERPYDTLLIDHCIKRRKRENVLLILVTEGGDADAAYRIARCFQANYEKFFLYVSGYCKSAGTLIATGAHELIMSDHGELGPLDVQMDRKDELWETQSGLEITDTLDALHTKAFNAFEAYFLTIKAKGGGSITLKMAMQMATEMTTSLLTPIYSQVNPLSVGEAGRAMSIASSYGKRLLAEGRNIEEKDLLSITTAYPSHGFVIDYREAERLFQNVRQPTQDEMDLVDELGGLALFPEEDEPPFIFLSAESPETDEQLGKDIGGKNGEDHENKDPQEFRHGGPLEYAPRQSPAGHGSTDTPPDGHAKVES